jgi:signal transduction histidine kinase
MRGGVHHGRLPNPVRLVRWFGATILAMLVGLVGLCVVVHSAAGRIDEAARSIAGNTAPSIVALEATSVALGRLSRSLAQELRAPGSAGAGAIAAQRRAVAESAGRYFALPMDPGEAEVIADLRRHLTRLDRVADRILAEAPDASPHAREVLKGELEAAKGAVDDDIVKAFDINAQIEYAAAESLRSVGMRVLPGVMALEIASGAAALLALGAAYRVSRTERELTERWLLERKNAELNAFAGRVAHDVLSPLMTVSMALGLAAQRLSGPGDRATHTALTRAGSALQRVRRLVVDLLEFARAGAPPATGVKTAVAPEMENLIGELQPVASDAEVELSLVGVSRRSVPCPAGILSSMLSNLIQNAIRYTGHESERRVEVRAVDAGPEVRFEVEDTGPGVPPEDRDRIFEPFVRRSAEGAGLGLGLATVKRLAESHGGHVGMRPAAGHGSLFWISLPAVG